jgi:hypothetical protein
MAHRSKHPQTTHFAFLKKDAPLVRSGVNVFAGPHRIQSFSSIRKARRYMRTGSGDRA